MDNTVAEKTDASRLDALDVDVSSLKKDVEDLGTRTLSMDKKLDTLLIREEAKKGRDPSYYIGLIIGTLVIAGSVLTAANWYVRSAIGETVGTALTQADYKHQILEFRIKHLEQAFSWTPSLVANARLKENTQ